MPFATVGSPLTTAMAALVSSPGRAQASRSARIISPRNSGTGGSRSAFCTQSTNSARTSGVSFTASARVDASSAALASP
jgi:hypothetical protein